MASNAPRYTLNDQGSDRLPAKILAHNNEEFCKGVASGLRWALVDAEVEGAYPDLHHIFQRALNVEHNIGEGVDTIKSHIIQIIKT